VQSSRPQKATPCAETRHTTNRSLRTVRPFFAQLTLLPNPSRQKSYALQCFSIGQTPQSAPSGGGIYASRPYMFPASTRLRIPNCTSISSAVFAQLTAANSYTLQRAAPSHTPQNCPFVWEIWTPSDTWFFGSTRVHNTNGISIGSAVLQGSRL